LPTESACVISFITSDLLTFYELFNRRDIFVTATNATQGLADYFVLALISNNESHPRTTDLFEVNRQILCVYVSEWPVSIRSDSLFRGLFFSVGSEDELGQSRHITSNDQIRGPERVMTKHTNLRGCRNNILDCKKKINLKQDLPSVFISSSSSVFASTRVFFPNDMREAGTRVFCFGDSYGGLFIEEKRHQ